MTRNTIEERANTELLPRKAFVFTTSWDDGTVYDLRLADLLSKYQLPATFYIAKRHERSSLAECQIRELARHFELGAHTLNHVDLDSVPLETAQAEIEGSKLWIETLSNSACTMFCFPHGNFSSSHLRLVQKAGFTGARTVELMSTSSPKLTGGIALVPTTIQAFPHSRSTYLANALKRSRMLSLRFRVSSLRRGDWLSMAKCLFSEVSANGGVFHLWGHSWEIERHGLWTSLEDMFRVAAQCSESGEYVTNGQLCTEYLLRQAADRRPVLSR